ncbi:MULTISPECIES: hypothetical protein [unclassified Rhizobium]|uniref:hypothetical protein n=1 Tax=unclassified Rhizobium TaxID=2613769 RepID=UPI001AE83057|nr:MULTISPECIES: hypothetical protein [unclassified Rhizobium]MBP2460148.1 hypothetical protein [Rhizobium sp. PvP014]MBP2531507.1 hypothetical protein [Rhizobium sp. PvP099]
MVKEISIREARRSDFFAEKSNPENLTLKVIFDHVKVPGNRREELADVIDIHLWQRQNILILVEADQESAGQIFRHWPVSGNADESELLEAQPAVHGALDAADDAPFSLTLHGAAEPHRFRPSFWDVFGSWRSPTDRSIAFWLDHQDHKNKRSERKRDAVEALIAVCMPAALGSTETKKQISDNEDEILNDPKIPEDARPWRLLSAIRGVIQFTRCRKESAASNPNRFRPAFADFFAPRRDPADQSIAFWLEHCGYHRRHADRAYPAVDAMIKTRISLVRSASRTVDHPVGDVPAGVADRDEEFTHQFFPHVGQAFPDTTHPALARDQSADLEFRMFRPSFWDVFGSWRSPTDRSIAFWLDHQDHKNKRSERKRDAVEALIAVCMPAALGSTETKKQISDNEDEILNDPKIPEDARPWRLLSAIRGVIQFTRCRKESAASNPNRFRPAFADFFAPRRDPADQSIAFWLEHCGYHRRHADRAYPAVDAMIKTRISLVRSASRTVDHPVGDVPAGVADRDEEFTHQFFPHVGQAFPDTTHPALARDQSADLEFRMFRPSFWDVFGSWRSPTDRSIAFWLDHQDHKNKRSERKRDAVEALIAVCMPAALGSTETKKQISDNEDEILNDPKIPEDARPWRLLSAIRGVIQFTRCRKESAASNPNRFRPAFADFFAPRRDPADQSIAFWLEHCGYHRRHADRAYPAVDAMIKTRISLVRSASRTVDHPVGDVPAGVADRDEEFTHQFFPHVGQAFPNTTHPALARDQSADLEFRMFRPSFRDVFGSWRSPTDRSIAFWLDHQEHKNKRSERKRDAVEALIRTQISAVRATEYFLAKGTAPGKTDESRTSPFPFLRLRSAAYLDTGTQPWTKGDNSCKSRLTNWKGLYARALAGRKRFRIRRMRLGDFGRGETSGSIWFLQRLLDHMLQEPTAALSPWGRYFEGHKIGQLSILEAKARATRAPEHAALIVLGLTYDALLTGDLRMLSRALPILAGLALHADFVAALNLARKNRSRQYIELMALDVFVKALTVQDYDVDLGAYSDVTVHGLPLLSLVTYRPRGWAPIPATRRLVAEGKVPLSILSQGSAKDDLEIITIGPTLITGDNSEAFDHCSASGRIGCVVDAKALRIAQYSADEEAFSKQTANVASALIAGIKDLLGSSEARTWVKALELPVDDLVFKAASEFWGVVCHIRNSPEDGLTIVTARNNLQAAFFTALKAGAHPKAVRIASLNGGFKPSANDRELIRQIADIFFHDPEPMDHASARLAVFKALDKGLEIALPAVAAGSAMITGRLLDRNYSTDIKELGRELRKSNRVFFLPTVRQPLSDQISSIVDFTVADWHDDIIKQPADSQFNPMDKLRPQRWPAMLPYLVEFAVRNNLLDLAGMALLVAAGKRLDDFFRSNIYNYMQAGAEAATSVSTIAPAFVVLLPGRDFISQVACLVGREKGVPSFDVQTVFVGPRSRYKPTMADIQFTIETQSQELFTSYFGLPIEKIMLSGCSKVGVVQDAARQLDRGQVRRSARMEDKFLLVFAGSPFLEEDQAIISTIADLAATLSEVHLGIRLHPTADKNFPEFCSELSKANSSVSVLNSLDLPETLTVADILITRFSNVGLEAALAGRDVIACNFNSAAPPISLDHMGVATIARSPEELCSCIEDFRIRGTRWNALQESRRTYLGKNAHFFAGAPAANMSRLIADHLRSFRR